MHDNLSKKKVDTCDDLPLESPTCDKSEVMQGDGVKFKGWFPWFRTSQFSNKVIVGMYVFLLHVDYCSDLL